jgi:hypothetical protein
MNAELPSMPSMSIRGLNAKALLRLKRRAARDGTSLNALVVRLLESDTGAATKPGLLLKFDDLDALAGTWTRDQTRAFERDTAAFSEVDPQLWK